jgi:hypothetical protein
VTGAAATASSSSPPTLPTTPTDPTTTTTTTTVTTPTTVTSPTIVSQTGTQDTTSPAAATVAPAATATTTDPSVLGAMGGAMGLAMGLAPTSPSSWSPQAAAPDTGSWAGLDFSRFGFDTSTLATAAPQVPTWWGDQGTAAASQADNSFALLNQYLAGSSGGGDGGMIAVAMSGSAWTQNPVLTKPQS